MRISMPRNIIRAVQRAVVEFDLLEAGDRILVGLSGGKDSTLLLYALSIMVKHLNFPVELSAMTIDLGFKKIEDTDYSSLSNICEELQVPYNIIRAELGQDILNNPKQNPCARCSYFRRAFIHNYAKDKGLGLLLSDP
jgi:tRNA(Ile)-lysidine synthase TilS/MesJ